MFSTRLVDADDAAALAELVARNRDYLTPWTPTITDDVMEESGMRRILCRVLSQHDAGTAFPCVIVRDGVVVGQISLFRIEREDVESACLGYWVGQEWSGQGAATQAVAEILRVAFADLRLHRIEAATVLENIGSQIVLERNGFTQIGVAHQSIRINGAWRDHFLYERLTDSPS
jgi:ribosomal-protein-alanine N-acetyltransferase